MQEAFQQDRQSLDELRAMLHEDSAIRAIRNDWLGTMNGVTVQADEQGATIDSQRWNEYRAKFRRLGLQGGITRATQGPCEFYAFRYGSGFVFSSVTKGYAFCTSVPSPLVEDLDRDDVRAKTMTFRALRESWYLFYEFD